MTTIYTEEPRSSRRQPKVPEDYAKAHSIAILIRRIAWAVCSITIAIFLIWLSFWGRHQIETRLEEDETPTSVAPANISPAANSSAGRSSQLSETPATAIQVSPFVSPIGPDSSN